MKDNNQPSYEQYIYWYSIVEPNQTPNQRKKGIL